MTPEFLRMQEISKSFDGTQALQRVNFSAAAGEVHAISGENGAGKSTLVKILSGALPSDAGEIFLDGELIELGTPLRARRLGIYAVYQEFSLVPHLTVAENSDENSHQWMRAQPRCLSRPRCHQPRLAFWPGEYRPHFLIARSWLSVTR